MMARNLTRSSSGLRGSSASSSTRSLKRSQLHSRLKKHRRLVACLLACGLMGHHLGQRGLDAEDLAEEIGLGPEGLGDGGEGLATAGARLGVDAQQLAATLDAQALHPLLVVVVEGVGQPQQRGELEQLHPAGRRQQVQLRALELGGGPAMEARHQGDALQVGAARAR